LQESAIELFKVVRLGGHGKDIAESNFDRLITEAATTFKKTLPFGEDAANTISFKDRILMKSERISPQDKD
jgi:hypothetical protein